MSSDLIARLRSMLKAAPHAELLYITPYQVREAADALEAAEAREAELVRAGYDMAHLLDAAEAKLAAIDALHYAKECYPPTEDGGKRTLCAFDLHYWPCPTHRLLHPQEETA